MGVIQVRITQDGDGKSPSPPDFFTLGADAIFSSSCR